MKLEDIKEVKECRTQEEVNDLLQQGNWKLIDTKVAKLRIPNGKVQVGVDTTKTLYKFEGHRYEIKYREELVGFYIVGRFE